MGLASIRLRLRVYEFTTLGQGVLAIATLPRFTLKHNKQNDRWQVGDTVKSFSHKAT